MISVEPRKSEEILKGLDREKGVFFIGCSGWKSLCNPGGEAQLQRMKKEMELRGVTFTGTMVVDALCNKGLDELSLLRQFRQVLRLVEYGLIKVDDLVSARWPLERVGEAFQSVMRANGLKHVVSFEGR